jgi:hypothetical protein
LPPVGDEILLPKTSSGVFNSTNIDYVLKNLGIRYLVVCGRPDRPVRGHDGARRRRPRLSRHLRRGRLRGASTPERHAGALKAFGGYCWVADTGAVRGPLRGARTRGIDMIAASRAARDRRHHRPRRHHARPLRDRGKRLDKAIAGTGVGWLQANLSLTPFNSIVRPNPWGSTGDLRLVPGPLGALPHALDRGSATPFDLVAADIVELDGSAVGGLHAHHAARGARRIRQATGLTVVAAFEQEFQLLAGPAGSAPAHAHAVSRRSGAPIRSHRGLMACVEEAGRRAGGGASPNIGADQFEVTHAPADALAAADRAIAIREITRELARNARQARLLRAEAGASTPSATASTSISASSMPTAGRPPMMPPTPGGCRPAAHRSAPACCATCRRSRR